MGYQGAEPPAPDLAGRTRSAVGCPPTGSPTSCRCGRWTISSTMRRSNAFCSAAVVDSSGPPSGRGADRRLPHLIQRCATDIEAVGRVLLAVCPPLRDGHVEPGDRVPLGSPFAVRRAPAADETREHHGPTETERGPARCRRTTAITSQWTASTESLQSGGVGSRQPLTERGGATGTESACWNQYCTGMWWMTASSATQVSARGPGSWRALPSSENSVPSGSAVVWPADAAAVWQGLHRQWGFATVPPCAASPAISA